MQQAQLDARGATDCSICRADSGYRVTTSRTTPSVVAVSEATPIRWAIRRSRRIWMRVRAAPRGLGVAFRHRARRRERRSAGNGTRPQRAGRFDQIVSRKRSYTFEGYAEAAIGDTTTRICAARSTCRSQDRRRSHRGLLLPARRVRPNTVPLTNRSLGVEDDLGARAHVLIERPSSSRC